MKAKVLTGELAGHVFEVVECGGEFLEIFVPNEQEKIAALRVKETKLKKSDCEIYNSFGIKVEPCSFCGKLSEGSTCPKCLKALEGLDWLMSKAKGRVAIKNKLEAK